MTNQPRGELVPGGLAMVYGDVETPQANGRFVTLVEFGDYRCIGHPDLVSGWDCKAEWLREIAPVDSAVFLAKNLLPINPSADPLEISQQQEVEA